MGTFIGIVALVGAFFTWVAFVAFAIEKNFWPALFVPLALFLMLVCWFVAKHETCDGVEKKEL